MFVAPDLSQGLFYVAFFLQALNQLCKMSQKVSKSPENAGFSSCCIKRNNLADVFGAAF
jgi:hypothetical protein